MGKEKLNLIGKKFSRLTVLSFVDCENGRTRWLCQCKCGRQCVIEGTSLCGGNSKSCGCLQRELAAETPSLIGQRFGRLLVVATAKSKHNRARWTCLCDCGKQCEAVGKTLKKGKKRSCGCLRREASFAAKDYTHERTSTRVLYGQYRCNAERDGKDFTLTEEEFSNLAIQPCFYCGRIPTTFNGVDRKCSSIGYLIENCAACCKKCNYMKGSQTVEDFIAACAAVSNHKRLAEMSSPESSQNS